MKSWLFSAFLLIELIEMTPYPIPYKYDTAFYISQFLLCDALPSIVLFFLSLSTYLEMAKLELNNAFNHPILMNLSLELPQCVCLCLLLSSIPHTPNTPQIRNNESNTNAREKKCTLRTENIYDIFYTVF